MTPYYNGYSILSEGFLSHATGKGRIRRVGQDGYLFRIADDGLDSTHIGTRNNINATHQCCPAVTGRQSPRSLVDCD